MAFTTSRKVREIGIRIALGARRHEVVAAVLSLTSRQIAIGVLAGGAITLLPLLAPGRLRQRSAEIGARPE